MLRRAPQRHNHNIRLPQYDGNASSRGARGPNRLVETPVTTARCEYVNSEIRSQNSEVELICFCNVPGPRLFGSLFPLP